MLTKIKNRLPFVSQISDTIFRNTLFVFALRFLQKTLGIAATYFVVRALSQEEFGEYHFILSIVGILTIFSLRGLNNSIMQSVARGFIGTYRAAVPLAFYSSLVGSLILAGIGGWYFLDGQQEMAFGCFIAASLFPFARGLTQWKAVKSGEENFPAIFKLEGTAIFIMNILIIGGVILVPGTLLIPLVILLAIPALQNCLITFLNLKTIKRDVPKEDKSISYGIKTSLYGGFNTVANHSVKLLLFFFLSPAILAIYIAANQLAELVRNMVQDIAAVLAPRFAKHSHYTARLDRAIKMFSLGIGLLIIGFAFTLLPWVLVTIFGESYREAIPYSQALLCSVVIGNIATLRFRFIRSRLDAASFRNITIITSFTRVLAAVILVPLWGLVGAVITAFIHRFSLVIITHFIIKKHYPILAKAS